MKEWQYPPTNKRIPIVVQGQRVTFERNPTTGALTGVIQPLLRAEDPNVHVWDVILSPVFRDAVGPDGQGMPTFSLGELAGAPAMRLTWGGGGVSWRQELNYPVRGACFSVAGENVMVEVFPFDTVTVYPPGSVPSVVAWVRPSDSAAPKSSLWQAEPLSAVPPGTLYRVPPFARNLVLTKTPATATFTLTWSGGIAGLMVQAFPGIQQFATTVPVPDFAQEVLVTPSVGATVNAQWEHVFS